ncbi:uncharacterized protein VNE69_02259 [Vairimorpha necatrix]|uniref:Uncharacterized protein n=1 Tax=Vairimorpha necatrix TaxID=6039 RepID=A0AAX4J9X2_9MICR
MIFLFLYKIFTMSGREIFDSWTKNLVRTNTTIYTDTMELVPNSRYVREDSLDYSSCNADKYFSYIEPLDISRLNYKDLRIASKFIYLELRQDKLYRKTLKEMLKTEPMINITDNFENFHMYVLSFIKSDIDEEIWEPYLLVKSMAYRSYKLIYLLSYIELDEQAKNFVSKLIKRSLEIKTEKTCKWQLYQLMRVFSYYPLCLSIEGAINREHGGYGWPWGSYFHKKQ